MAAKRKSGIPKSVSSAGKIYDNGGKTIDRYSFVHKRRNNHIWCEILSMNSAPSHPQGFGQHTEGRCDTAFGKRIRTGAQWRALPEGVRRAILREVK